MLTRRSLAGVLCAAALGIMALPPAHSTQAAAPAPRPLAGAVPGVVSSGHAQFLGARPASETMSITIGLATRGGDALAQMAANVSDPASPSYGQFLTPEQAAAEFYPTAAQEQQVENWLTAHGLTVTGTYANHLMVDAQGTVGQIEALLHVTIGRYQAAIAGKQQSFFAPESTPTIDAAVSNQVDTVVGLDSVPRFHHAANGSAHGTVPYYPQDFANAYDVNPLWNAGYKGSGRRIGITLWGAPATDAALNQFASRTGASVATTANGRLTVHAVDGGSTLADDGEAGLDIEYTSALAPSAAIDYWEVPTDVYGNPSAQGLLDALNLAGTTDNVISSSWGGCEASSTSDPFTAQAEKIFAANTVTGRSYLFATGDNGSWCDPYGDGTGVNPYPDYPASSPNVTAVGGTTWLAAPTSGYPGETAWKYCSTCDGGAPEGSGGGFSTIFARPSWETGTTHSKRGYPDIAADADPNTGALVCYGSGSCAQIGGTSLATPLWSGIAADLDQYLAAHGKPALGLIASTVNSLATHTYSAAPLHDVRSGTNGSYSAGTSWDAVTGWGSPDVWNIANDLAGSSVTATPTASPTPAATSVPIVGTLTNGGFENGQSPWTWSSSLGDTPIITSQAYAGTHSAQFCGKMSCLDVLTQTITLPSTFTAATLSYMVKGQTNNTTTCDDFLTTQIKTGTGSLITTPARLCNISSSWLARSLTLTTNLLPYAGKQVQVSFVAQTGSADLTSYWLDNVSLTLSGTSPTATPTSTPKPTTTSTPKPTATGTPRPTATSTPKPTATGTPRPTATSTPKPTATSTPRPTATSTPKPTSTSTPTSGNCSTTSTCLQSMLSLLNSDRAANGVGPLTLNMTETNGTSTCVGSYGHSVHMAQIGQISHDQFPTDICIAYMTAGENVGEANTGSEWGDLKELDSLMMSEPHSPGCTGNHACNIISASFHQVGIGIYRNAAGTTWLTEDFTN